MDLYIKKKKKNQLNYFCHTGSFFHDRGVLFNSSSALPPPLLGCIFIVCAAFCLNE